MSLRKAGNRRKDIAPTGVSLGLPTPVWPEGFDGADLDPKKPMASAARAFLTMPSNVKSLIEALFYAGVGALKVEAIRELMDRVDGPTVKAVAHASFTQDMAPEALNAKINKLLDARERRALPQPQEEQCIQEGEVVEESDGATTADYEEAFGADQRDSD